MARKSSRRALRPPRPATYAQLQEVRADLRRTMGDFIDLAERFEKFTTIQLERIAQIQAELDDVRSAWTRTTPNPQRTRNPQNRCAFSPYYRLRPLQQLPTPAPFADTK